MSEPKESSELPFALRRLIQKAIDARLTTPEFRQLQESLRDDPVARMHYLHAVQLHTELGVRGQARKALHHAFEQYPTGNGLGPDAESMDSQYAETGHSGATDPSAMISGGQLTGRFKASREDGHEGRGVLSLFVSRVSYVAAGVLAA